MVASTHDEEIELFHEVLKRKFNVTMNLDISSHLGISMDKLPDGRIRLRQSKLLDEIFKEYPTDNRVKYPTQPRSRKGTVDTTPYNQTEYLKLLGKLMYMTNSRPDILTSLSYAGTKSLAPTADDFQILLEIVGYLKETEDQGLILFTRENGQNQDIQCTCYVDAFYLSHSDGRSHTGYCIGLSPVGIEPKSYYYNKSSKQKLVSTSSTHAEMRALYELTVTIIFVTYLLEEIGRPIKVPVLIFEDNQPVLDLTEEMSGTKSSKNFMMLTNFIQEQVRAGLIHLVKVDTKSNLSNVLTKILTGQEFLHSLSKILGTSPH